MIALLDLLAWVALPGLALGVWLTRLGPQPTRPGTLVARCSAAGIIVWLVASGSLERICGISPASSYAAAAVVAVLSLFSLSLPRSRAVLRESAAEAGYFALVLLVLLTSWFPILRLVVQTSWGPLGSTPWYYWVLAQRVAEQGHVPDHVVEWGTSLSSLDDYHLFTTGTAVFLAPGRGFDVRAIQGVTLLSAALLAIGAVALARSLGATRLTSLVAVPFAVASGVGSFRIAGYRPEALGLGLALLLVAAVADWLLRGDRGAVAVAALLAATLAQVHGLALITSGAMLAALSVSTLMGRRSGAHAARVGLAAGALLVAVLALGVTIGRLSGSGQAAGLPEAAQGLADPTWRFIRAIRGDPPSHPPSNAYLLRTAITSVFEQSGWWAFASMSVATIVLVACALRGSGTARRTLVFSLCSLAVLAAIASFFAFNWTSYVPRRTGSSRLAQEASLLVGPYVACGLSCGLGALRPAQLAQRRGPIAVVVLIALGTAAFTSSWRLAGVLQNQRPSPADLRALARLHLPRAAVVLTNAYTEGYIEMVSGAQGLLEGRAPYTYPRVLARANRLLNQAHDFYGQPARHLDFIRANDVSYVAISSPGSFSLASSSFVAGAHRRALERCPGLTPILSRPHLVVYSVDRQIGVKR